MALEEVIVTEELDRRPPRAADHAAESRALVGLAQAMADAPETILRRLVETAMELCRADTAGVSLLEEQDGELVFRWHAIAGAHAAHLMGMAPRDFSPCGVVIDRGAPQLFAHPGRHFAFLDAAEPRVAETLLVPFYINRHPVGTIWLVARDDRRRFDAEDVRVLTSLAQFCAACLHAVHPRLSTAAELLADRLIAEQPAARQARATRDELVEQRVEAARREAQRRFSLLVQNVPDYAIFMLDPEGRVTIWNDGAARLKGYTEQEILGRHFSIFFTPEDQARGMPEHERGMAEIHGRYEGEGWRVRKDGTRFWGNEILTALRGADGQLVGFTKVARDLTDRKRMEDALREGEERYRLLVENIRDHAVHTIDPDGRITSWNPGAQRAFGYAADEVVGRPVALLFTPEDRAAGQPGRELAAAAADGQASDDRWQMRKDGTRFWANGVTSAIRDGGGALRGFAKVCRDQTDAKRVEEQRERLLERETAARQEAEQAAVIRDEFLAVVSHELRTPLAAILIWAKMLQSGVVRGPQRAEALDTIAQSAEAQRKLIDDLLDTSRMLSGKLRVDLRETDLASVVEAALDAVRPMAEAKGVTLVDSLDPRAGRVLADPDRLQQVAWNLLNNAVKFTDRGGRVDVRLERHDSVLRFEVSDTGRGISPEFLPHVFERFRQQDASTTRAVGGLGLGLAITRQLVELHGGTARAASPGEGMGSTFTVDLPLAAAGAKRGEGTRAGRAAAAKAWVPSPVLAGLGVLLVEDEPATRTAVQWLLEQCGARVTPADSAARGVAALGHGPGLDRQYDVYVFDVGLPGHDGYELLRQVRAAERKADGGRTVPAVALTAYVRPEDRAMAMAAGYQAHLGKPVEPEALVATVARLAGRPVA
jgi:PAS domain S-box-containing protein